MIHERIGWFFDSKTHEGAGRPGSICVFPMKNAEIIGSSGIVMVEKAVNLL